MDAAALMKEFASNKKDSGLAGSSEGTSRKQQEKEAQHRPTDVPGYRMPQPSFFPMNFWKEFEGESTRALMDEQCGKIADNQEATLKNWRRLADATKEFEKAPLSEQFERFKPLLKDYQEELDSMAKRARYAEGVFVQMCQRVYRAMDMSPAFPHPMFNPMQAQRPFMPRPPLLSLPHLNASSSSAPQPPPSWGSMPGPPPGGQAPPSMPPHPPPSFLNFSQGNPPFSWPPPPPGAAQPGGNIPFFAQPGAAGSAGGLAGGLGGVLAGARGQGGGAADAMALRAGLRESRKKKRKKSKEFLRKVRQKLELASRMKAAGGGPGKNREERRQFMAEVEKARARMRGGGSSGVGGIVLGLGAGGGSGGTNNGVIDLDHVEAGVMEATEAGAAAGAEAAVAAAVAGGGDLMVVAVAEGVEGAGAEGLEADAAVAEVAGAGGTGETLASGEVAAAEGTTPESQGKSAAGLSSLSKEGKGNGEADDGQRTAESNGEGSGGTGGGAELIEIQPVGEGVVDLKSDEKNVGEVEDEGDVEEEEEEGGGEDEEGGEDDDDDEEEDDEEEDGEDGGGGGGGAAGMGDLFGEGRADGGFGRPNRPQKYRTRHVWHPREDNVLLDYFYSILNTRKCTSGGFKSVAYNEAAAVLNGTCGTRLEGKQVMYRMDWMKRVWKAAMDLKEKPGWRWDDKSMMMMGPSTAAWVEEIAANGKVKPLHGNQILWLPKATMVFGSFPKRRKSVDAGDLDLDDEDEDDDDDESYEEWADAVDGGSGSVPSEPPAGNGESADMSSLKAAVRIVCNMKGLSEDEIMGALELMETNKSMAGVLLGVPTSMREQWIRQKVGKKLSDGQG